jgi:hypothetical protein
MYKNVVIFQLILKVTLPLRFDVVGSGLFWDVGNLELRPFRPNRVCKPAVVNAADPDSHSL